MYYPSSENKGADQLRGVNAKLICVFVFAYANCWFSHEAAHLINCLYIFSLIRIISFKLGPILGPACLEHVH